MPHIFNHGYAVVTGVGADLPITIDDAHAIANQLTDSTRCGYPTDQVRLLTNEGARRVDILSALSWLAEVTGEQDTALVYFSGHGIESPDFHLIPFGFDWNKLAETAISGQEFTQALRAIRAQKLLILLDCCHAAGQAEAKGHIHSPLPTSVLNELGRSSGRVVIASSRKDELSWTGKPYSQFTIAVLEALAGYGAFEHDGFARVLDLAMWVGRVVPERTNDKQHPIIKVSNLEDNFALAWYAGGEPAPKTLSWADRIPSVNPQLAPVQLATWQRMLVNYRENLLLIEERMSEYIEATEIPLQLIRSKRQVEIKITELEQKLGLRT